MVLWPAYYVPGRKQRSISESTLRALLESDPDITLAALKTALNCGSDTIARELERHGLRTKVWAERKHRSETRGKISKSRKDRGVARGELNPNHGLKPRPWLEGDRHPFRRWHQDNPEFGARQRGAANPINSVKYLYEDPAYLSRITIGIRAHTEAKKGKSYEEVYGDEKAKEYREKLRLASPKRLAKFKRKVTAPELQVRQLLTSIGVPFQEQYPIGPYTVDFYVPSRGLVVQADGDYWHANPRAHTNLSQRQVTQCRLDASCNAYLRNRGYVVLRLWESDLKSAVDKCLLALKKEMEIRI